MTMRFLQCKDVSVSFGAKEKHISETVISPSAAARGGDVAAGQFNMLLPDRPSALSTTGPFVKIPQHTSVEVTYRGKQSLRFCYWWWFVGVAGG